jgi:hypothetical protein
MSRERQPDGRCAVGPRSHDEGTKVENEKSNPFWADVSVLAATPVAIAAGVTKGAYDAVTDNGPFVDGFSSTAGSIRKAARGFGEEHSGTITKAVVTGAAGALGARILRAVIRL